MKIPIAAAATFAKEHNLTQVIIFGWDGEQTSVVTYGETITDCAQAAAGANKIKAGWGWPESTLTEPPRVKSLLAKLDQALAENECLRNNPDKKSAL